MEWDVVSTAIEAGGVLPLLAYIYHRSEKHQEQLEQRMERHRSEDQERHDTMVKGWQSQLNEMEERSQTKVESVRARYDVVVDRYNTERDKLYLDMSKKMEDLDRKLDNIVRNTGSRNG